MSQKCEDGPENQDKDRLCASWAIVKATRDAAEWSRIQALIALFGLPVLLFSGVAAFRSLRQARREFASSDQADCEVVGVKLASGWAQAIAAGNHALAFFEIANSGRRAATRLHLTVTKLTFHDGAGQIIVPTKPPRLQPLRGGGERRDRIAISLGGIGTSLAALGASWRVAKIVDIQIEGRLAYRSGREELTSRPFRFRNDDVDRGSLRMIEQEQTLHDQSKHPFPPLTKFRSVWMKVLTRSRWTRDTT